MKTKILLTLLVISCFAANAQNDNPYGIFGYKSNVVYENKKSDLFRIKIAIHLVKLLHWRLILKNI
jgi:hypothetical protein